MIRARMHTLVGMLACLFGGFVYAQAPGTGNGCEEYVSQQVIVKLQPHQSIRVITTETGTETIDAIPSQNLYLLRVPPQATAPLIQLRLSRDPRVAWAELNYVVVAPNGGTQSFFLFAHIGNYVAQHPIAMIEADEAHRFSTGRGQIVAVLDTGLDATHPAIAGRVAPGGYNYIDGNADTRDVGNGIDDNNDGRIDEMVGHGTMVSGLILRVAPGAAILPMRVLNCDGVGSSYYVARAMLDAADRGATVINASLGSIKPSQAVATAASEVAARGIVVVAAAGNHNRSDPRYYPAALSTVIAVAGTDWKDVKAPFSDFGTSIAISAPAVWLVGPLPGDQYAFGDGNSLASALVAGGAALVRAHQPGLTPLEVEARLRAGAVSLDQRNPAYIGQLGSGRLSLRQALIGVPILAQPR